MNSNENAFGRLAREIHENAIDHGWYENGNPPLPAALMNMVGELSEAMEEYRDRKPMLYFGCDTFNDAVGKESYLCDDDKSPCHFRNGRGEHCAKAKPEGVAVELADCLIRILDTCAAEGIDIDEVVRLKMEYNKSRPYRHGGKIV
ncbi:MAG: hypothetical protein LBN00_06445 [Oscillospiraceae bacterium]|jgi:NTP pyrophosphatase (non-canonical NTP hydrolase)|nr:hypothetical protein [Oscillospiraceae bacterium]